MNTGRSVSKALARDDRSLDKGVGTGIQKVKEARCHDSLLTNERQVLYMIQVFQFPHQVIGYHLVNQRY